MPSGCLHYGCCLRQPISPPKTQLKPNYVPPPPNIRLLPRIVSSYEAFRRLQTSHRCEECEDGSLFYNYHEMVQYPAPGPGGGTYGSPVPCCPNSPSAADIEILSTEEKRKYKKRNINCKFCDQKFFEKANLNFHLNRIHFKK